jgi:asparagine synthase (glutamine-hydrolysing)
VDHHQSDRAVSELLREKLAMAHGLECRVSVSRQRSHRFRHAAASAHEARQSTNVARLNENEPGGKAARYFERARDGKLILRDMMARHIPTAVAEREKQGFSAPHASWFKGESIDYVRRRLLNERPAFAATSKVTRALIEDHLEGRENRRLLI